MRNKEAREKLLGYEQLIEEIARINTKLYQYGFLVSTGKISYEGRVLSDSRLLEKILRENSAFITKDVKKKLIDW